MIHGVTSSNLHSFLWTAKTFVTRNRLELIESTTHKESGIPGIFYLDWAGRSKPFVLKIAINPHSFFRKQNQVDAVLLTGAIISTSKNTIISMREKLRKPSSRCWLHSG